MILNFPRFLSPSAFLLYLSMYLPCFLGNRYITVTESMWAPEMAKILEEEFKPLGKIMPVGLRNFRLSLKCPGGGGMALPYKKDEVLIVPFSC